MGKSIRTSIPYPYWATHAVSVDFDPQIAGDKEAKREICMLDAEKNAPGRWAIFCTGISWEWYFPCSPLRDDSKCFRIGWLSVTKFRDDYGRGSLGWHLGLADTPWRIDIPLWQAVRHPLRAIRDLSGARNDE